ncbi:hypothetical protein [Haliangium sp.]
MTAATLLRLASTLVVELSALGRMRMRAMNLYTPHTPAGPAARARPLAQK